MQYIQKIEAALREKKLTAKRMLLDLGYSDNLISQWKKGSEPSAFKLQRIAKYLELSLDYLFSDSDTMKSPAPNLTSSELEALAAFRRLGPVEQGKIIGRMEAMAEHKE